MRPICLAVVAGAHGVKGLVKLKSFTAVPQDLAAYGPVSDERGRRFQVTLKGRVKDGLLASLSGIATREEAQALRGARLYVDRAALPEIAEADTYYQADLIGLAVETLQGEALGCVSAAEDYGAGTILEIARAEGPPLLLPFTRAVVPDVDLAAGRLIVALPEEAAVPPGLEEEAGKEGPQGAEPGSGPAAARGLDKATRKRHKPRLREGSSGDA